MIKYSLLLYTLIIQKKSWLCPYFEIGCAEICMHLEFCAQRDLRGTSAPACALFYERNILNHSSSLYVSENTRRPSEMSLFQIRFSWVLHCFVWFRVINLNHKTVIFEVPLVTNYHNLNAKYVSIGSQLKQIACCFTAVCWSSVCDLHFNCGIIDGGTFTLFTTYLLQLTTQYDTLGMWHWSTVLLCQNRPSWNCHRLLPQCYWRERLFFWLLLVTYRHLLVKVKTYVIVRS